MKGTVVLGSFVPVDVEAPGAGEFVNFVPLSNTQTRVTVRKPTGDAGGGPLTGLKRAKLAQQQGGEETPFTDLAPEAIEALGVTVTPVEIADGDAEPTLDVVVTHGQNGTVWLALWYEDQ